MHHKRGRPKTSRAGCMLCHPNKNQRAKKVPRSKRALAIVSERPDALELLDGFIHWGECADIEFDDAPENDAPPVFCVALKEAI